MAKLSDYLQVNQFLIQPTALFVRFRKKFTTKEKTFSNLLALFSPPMFFLCHDGLSCRPKV